MIKNCGLLQFRKIQSVSDKKLGALTPIECPLNIPFDVKRVYYIYGVDKGITRGFHSHRKLHQVLIAVNGRVKIRLKTPNEEEIVELNDPSVGLYIGPMVWREMFDFEDGAVLLVLASDVYDEADYIRDWDAYSIESSILFKENMVGSDDK